MKRFLDRLRRDCGFSAPETAAVMAGLSILTATAAPNLQEFLETARMTKARGDVRVLTVSVVRLMNDVGAIVGGPDRAARPELLVGPGAAPAAAVPDALGWTLAEGEGRVGTFAAHLVDNRAGYPERESGQRWRGPYMENVSPDPWGFRYALNLAYVHRGSGAAAVVLSPGPNGLVETPFAAARLDASGDDIIGLVTSGR